MSNVINLTAQLSKLSQDLTEAMHELKIKEAKLAEELELFEFDDDYRHMLEQDIQTLEDHIDIVENSIADIEEELDQLSNQYTGGEEDW